MGRETEPTGTLANLFQLVDVAGAGGDAGTRPAHCVLRRYGVETPERKDMAGSVNDGALVHEKGCDMGVAAVRRTRISIARGRRLCEQARELRLQVQDARTRTHALAVRAAYSAERAHLAAEWVACVAARPRLRA